MIRTIYVTLLFFTAAFVTLADETDWEPVVDESTGRPMQKMSFSTPEHTEEQKESMFMPPELKCDGCKAVAFKLYEAFHKFNTRNKHHKYKLPESDVITIMDETCQDPSKTFESYGMKVINGIAGLSGPGLEHNSGPGVMAGGGKWPSRLGQMCEDFRGELDDMEIYAAYQEHPKNRKGLTEYLCEGTGFQGSCAKEKEEL